MKNLPALLIASVALSGCKPDVLGTYTQVGHSPWCFTQAGRQLACEYFSQQHCERQNHIAGPGDWGLACVPNPTDR
jgi:hypothetical protein